MNDLEPKPKTAIASGPRGLQLASLDDYYRFAQYVSASGLAPKGLEKPESILVALQLGAEVGLSPMASLQNVAVINGRPSLYGDAQLAICRSSGLFDESKFQEWDEKDTAYCTVCRKGGQPITRSFSMDEAKQASLVGKQGPWSQYPKRMRQMRARTFALRDAFTDVLRGIPSVEEAMDLPPQEPAPAVEVKTERATERPRRRQPVMSSINQQLVGIEDTAADVVQEAPGGMFFGVSQDAREV